MFAWGYNADGQLGDGSFENKALPCQVENINESVKLLDCSKFSSGAVTKSNRLFTWGSMKQGALGFNFEITSKNETVPREIFEF